RARVDVHDGRARLRRALRLRPDLLRRVGNRGALSASREHAGERRGDDRLRHTGMLPCLRHGRSTFLPAACSSPCTMARRVSAGSITSSIIAHPAATYGLIWSRIARRYCARVSSGLAEDSICLLKMMLTAPSGPMTE